MPSPVLDDHLGLLQSVKDFTVEQFVTELRVEAFTVAVLPWTASLDVGGLDEAPKEKSPAEAGPIGRLKQPVPLRGMQAR